MKRESHPPANVNPPIGVSIPRPFHPVRAMVIKLPEKRKTPTIQKTPESTAAFGIGLFEGAM